MNFMNPNVESRVSQILKPDYQGRVISDFYVFYDRRYKTFNLRFIVEGGVDFNTGNMVDPYCVVDYNNYTLEKLSALSWALFCMAKQNKCNLPLVLGGNTFFLKSETIDRMDTTIYKALKEAQQDIWWEGREFTPYSCFQKNNCPPSLRHLLD